MTQNFKTWLPVFPGFYGTIFDPLKATVCGLS